MPVRPGWSIPPAWTTGFGRRTGGPAGRRVYVVGMVKEGTGIEVLSCYSLNDFRMEHIFSTSWTESPP